MIMLAQFSQDSPYLNPPFLSVFSSSKHPFFFGMFDQRVGGDLQQKAPRRLCSRKWHQRLLPPAKTEDQFRKFQRKTQTTWSIKEVVLKRTNKEIYDIYIYIAISSSLCSSWDSVCGKKYGKGNGVYNLLEKMTARTCCKDSSQHTGHSSVQHGHVPSNISPAWTTYPWYWKKKLRMAPEPVWFWTIAQEPLWYVPKPLLPETYLIQAEASQQKRSVVTQ